MPFQLLNQELMPKYVLTPVAEIAHYYNCGGSKEEY